ncbi:hypothetical protein [Streptomyces vilmorinianum]|uniref:hypothetical protein n=1 Tax=Streptomyces vilmorinianum TaxID=3051092 RepID=UPI0010FAE328|nr:hypothetical protein [Streptomyces vilmorinianum]
MSGCSSYDPEQAKAWQRDYCTKLGSWQKARNATDPSVEAAGYAAIAVAKVLDREHLDHDGSHVLDDTARAVTAGDGEAEGRAVAYCGSSGFETLVR